MNFLLNMNIGKRLALAFGIATAVLIAIGGVGLSQIYAVDSLLVEITDNRVPKIANANGLIKNFLNIAIAARSAYIMIDSPDLVQEQLAKIADARDSNNKIMEYLDKATKSLEGREILANIKTKIAVFRESQDQVIALIKGGNASEAKVVLMKDFRERQHGVQQALDKLVEHENKEMARADHDADVLIAHANQIIIGVGIFSVLLSLLIARAITVSVTRPLAEAVKLADRISTGDLTSSGSVSTTTDEVGHLLSRLQSMQTDLSKTIGDVVTSARSVAGYADQLSSSADQVSSSIQSQASATSAAAAAVEQLTVSIETVSANAGDVSSKATEAGRTAESGGNHVKDATDSILHVSSGVEGAARDISSLAEKVQGVDQVAEVIRGIAEQTNLLALNAAIEAARAGEQGRGFAVVADEVRKLAERTTLSVQEIGGMTTTIKSGAEAAVTSMQTTSQDVAAVVTRAESATQSMTEICAAATAVEYATNEITSALTEQRTAATELSRNIESIAQMSEENSAAASAVADTAGKMSVTSKLLMSSVERFRL